MYLDGCIVDAGQIIGNGADGFIVRNGSTILKIPKLYGEVYRDGRIEYDEQNEFHEQDIELEKAVYHQLQGVPGVANCLGTSRNGITLEYYGNGSLEDYIHKREEPDLSVKQGWISEIVDVILRCHENHVLVFDIALRNFLLTDDLSIRIIDFQNRSLVPVDIDMDEAHEDGCTVQLDMLHLSSVIYSIIRWQKIGVQCDMDSEWPKISEMPWMGSMIYGTIVANCWNRRYKNVCELQHDLDRFSSTESIISSTPSSLSISPSTTGPHLLTPSLSVSAV